MSSLFVSYAVGDGDQRSGFGNMILSPMDPPQSEEDIKELQRVIKEQNPAGKFLPEDTIVVLGWACLSD